MTSNIGISDLTKQARAYGFAQDSSDSTDDARKKGRSGIRPSQRQRLAIA